MTPTPLPPDPTCRGVLTPPEGRPGVLLAVAQTVAAHADPAALIRDLAAALQPHLPPGYISFALLDPATRVAHLQLLEPVGPVARPDPADTPTELRAGDSPTAVVWDTQRPLCVSAADPPDRLPGLLSAFRRQGVQAACFVPLSTPRRRLGAMGFTSFRPVAAADEDVDFLAQIGRLVALAVEAALMRQELEQSHAQLARERSRLELLLEVGEAVTARPDLPGLLRSVGAGIARLTGHRLVVLWLPDPDGRHLRAAGDAGGASAVVPADGPGPGEAYRTGATVRVRGADGRTVIAIPLRCGDEAVGVIGLDWAAPDPPPDDLVGWLEQATRPVAVAVANTRAFRRTEELSGRPAEVTQFDDIVGDSPVLREALRQVESVAPTAATVLLAGETGTGKELFARAVHRLSGRSDRPFVKLNCAAIPTGLLESELFGHERGAFTGATDKRVGRFELADGGTLFLDEVGDIPTELQPKLLRVLQEREFERLGSGRTVRVDVRLIAATHRDLARMAAVGAFRPDLFYRLHVFPVRVPPLRERPDDIPALARHFVRVYAQKVGKGIDTVPPEVMAELRAHSWPGNVRELEHLIERAVILSAGPKLQLPGGFTVTPLGDPGQPAAVASLRSSERETIRRALDACGWVIGGPKGAAARLGLKRTTLLAKMKRHGLTRPTVSTG